MPTKTKTAASGPSGPDGPTLPSGHPNVGATGVAGGSPFPGIHREVTYDAITLDHWITDAELDQLTELRKDNVVEIFWGVLGIFLGSIVPAIERLPKLGNSNNPIGAVDLLILVICGVALVVTLVMAFFWYKRSDKAALLADKIRKRKKFSVANDGK